MHIEHSGDIDINSDFPQKGIIILTFLYSLMDPLSLANIMEELVCYQVI